MTDKRWNIEEDEPLQIIDSKGEYEPVCVLYSEDAPTVMNLLNQKEKEIEALKSLLKRIQKKVENIENYLIEKHNNKLDWAIAQFMYVEKNNEQSEAWHIILKELESSTKMRVK